MIENIKRISIVGGPGSGKSTLADNLGKVLELPVYHLDAIGHFENWQKRDEKERDKIILEKADEEKWIIDGTYRGTLEKRIKQSDIVIFLNYSTIAKLKGIFSRYFKLKGKERPEVPGCKERMNWTFIKFTIIWNAVKRKTIEELLDKYKKEEKEILIFKNRKRLNKWYEEKFNKKIEL